MKNILYTFTIALFSTVNLFGQLDTIAGPFPGTNCLAASTDRLYVAAVTQTTVEVRAYEGNITNEQGTLLFSNPFPNPISSMVVVDDDLYLVSSGATIADGRIYRVNEISSNAPQTELFLSLPWLPTNIAERDGVLYISKFFFSGGGIFTYDMNDPDAELQEFLATGTNSLTDFEIAGDQLYISDGTDDRVLRVDLSAENPTLSSFITGLDFPIGISIDEGLLYVAIANFNSNAPSKVAVYELDAGPFSVPLFEFADDTQLTLLDVAVVNSSSYVLENASEIGELAYLLRSGETVSSTSTAPGLRELKVFPNPTGGNILLSDINPNRVDVLNNAGVLMFSQVNNSREIDLSNLPTGLYYLRVFSEGNPVRTARVIKN